MKFRCIALFPMLWLSCNVYGQVKKVTLTSYGISNKGMTDIRSALRTALASADTVVIPKGRYLFNGQLKLNGLHGKTLIAKDAMILNTDNAVGTLYFDHCEGISVIGGTWTRTRMPEVIGASLQEHTLTFETCKNIKVEKVIINGSPQMGICIMNSIGVNINQNYIQNCFRDGVYAHYSAKIRFTGNRLKNIKDDALSIHDYGINQEKKALFAAGYQQAGDAVISGNITSNTYQGFSSIGCADLRVEGNRFSKTVNAGIAIFNSEFLFPGHTSNVKNVVISNNILTFNASEQVIMGRRYPDKGQLSSGRCALFVAVNDRNNYILMPVSRLQNITITGNLIRDCEMSGTYLAQIDRLVLSNNTFERCNLRKNIYATKTIDTNACLDKTVSNNAVSQK